MRDTLRSPATPCEPARGVTPVTVCCNALLGIEPVPLSLTKLLESQGIPPAENIHKITRCNRFSVPFEPSLCRIRWACESYNIWFRRRRAGNRAQAVHLPAPLIMPVCVSRQSGRSRRICEDTRQGRSRRQRCPRPQSLENASRTGLARAHQTRAPGSMSHHVPHPSVGENVCVAEFRSPAQGEAADCFRAAATNPVAPRIIETART